MIRVIPILALLFCLVTALSGKSWAQQDQAPAAPTDASLPATAPAEVTDATALRNELEMRSQVLDAREDTLSETERLHAEREQRLIERERLLNEREGQLVERERLFNEREQVFTTLIPFTEPPMGTEGDPGTKASPGEPDNFQPGLDGRTFQPGVGTDFFPGVLDTDNNFISP